MTDLPPGLQQALREMSKRGPVINLATGETVATGGHLVTEENTEENAEEDIQADIHRNIGKGAVHDPRRTRLPDAASPEPAR